MNKPGKSKVKRLRKELGLSTEACADMTQVSKRTWEGYEQEGKPLMPKPVWELFLIKTRQIEVEYYGPA